VPATDRRTDRQTDGQTDGFTIANTALNTVLTRCKNDGCQTFVVYEKVRSTMDDILMSKDHVQSIGRGRQDQGQSLLAATHSHVALIGRRLAQYSIEITRL